MDGNELISSVSQRALFIIEDNNKGDFFHCNFCRIKAEGFWYSKPSMSSWVYGQETVDEFFKCPICHYDEEH